MAASELTDIALRRYLAGALAPPRQALLEAALRQDAALRDRLERLRLEGAALDAPPDPWRLPPPGVAAARGLGATARAGAVMSDGEDGEAPDYIELRIQAPPDALPHRVLLLERGPAGWRVLAPASADEVFTAADLPLDADGTRRVDLALEGGAPWRFGVVLLPPAVVIPWQDPPGSRWADVQSRIARGELRVEAVQFG